MCPCSSTFFLLFKNVFTWKPATHVIPVLKKLKQEDCEFKVSLGYIVAFCLKSKAKQAKRLDLLEKLLKRLIFSLLLDTILFISFWFIFSLKNMIQYLWLVWGMRNEKLAEYWEKCAQNTSCTWMKWSYEHYII